DDDQLQHRHAGLARPCDAEEAGLGRCDGPGGLPAPDDRAAQEPGPAQAAGRLAVPRPARAVLHGAGHREHAEGDGRGGERDGVRPDAARRRTRGPRRTGGSVHTDAAARRRRARRTRRAVRGPDAGRHRRRERPGRAAHDGGMSRRRQRAVRLGWTHLRRPHRAGRQLHRARDSRQRRAGRSPRRARRRACRQRFHRGLRPCPQPQRSRQPPAVGRPPHRL
ncbi:MAG: Flagellar basal-body rod modification protein FlgD, partial [uncultured Lysobacter sp.]